MDVVYAVVAVSGLIYRREVTCCRYSQTSVITIREVAGTQANSVVDSVGRIDGESKMIDTITVVINRFEHFLVLAGSFQVITVPRILGLVTYDSTLVEMIRWRLVDIVSDNTITAVNVLERIDIDAFDSDILSVENKRSAGANPYLLRNIVASRSLR